MSILYRKWRIALAVSLSAVVVLFVGALVYLNSPAFHKRLLDEINGRLTGSVSFTSLDLSLFPGRIDLSDVRLAGPDGLPLIAIGGLRVRFYWWPLIHRRIHLAEVAVVGVVADLEFTTEDQLTLVQALSPPNIESSGQEKAHTPSAWNVIIDSIQLSIDRIGVQRPALQLNAQIQGLDLNGSIDTGRPEGQLNLEVARIEWRTDDHSGGLRHAVLNTVYDPTESKPLHLDLRLHQSQLQLSAAVDLKDPAGDLDADIAYALDLRDLKPWLPSGQEYTGLLQGRVNIQGSLFDPMVTLTMDIQNGHAAGIDIQKADLRLGLEHRVVTLEKIEGNGQWGEAALSGRVDLTGLFPKDFRKIETGVEALAYDLTLHARDLKPGALPSVDLPLDGIWKATANLSGRGVGDPASQGQASLEAQVVLPPETDQGDNSKTVGGQVKSRIGWEGRRIEVHTAEAVVGDNRFNADGSIDLGNEQIRAQGELNIGRPSDLEPIAGIPLPSGLVQLTFECLGTIRRPVVNSTVLSRQLAYKQWTFGRLFFNARLDHSGRLQIADLMLENQGSLIQGQGELRLWSDTQDLRFHPQLAARLDFEELQLSDFGLLPDLKGQLIGHLELSGPLADPVAELRLAPSTLGWNEMHATVESSARWGSGQLNVRSLHLTRGESGLGISGGLTMRDASTGQWLAEPIVDLTLVSNRLELEDLHPNASGSVDLNARISGSVANLQGQFNARAGNVVSTFQTFDAINVEGRLEGNTVFLDQLHLGIAPSQIVQAKGWYAFDRRFNLELSAEDLGVRHIEVLQQAYPVEGRMGLMVSGGGTLDQPNVQATLDISHPRFNHQAFDDFNATLNLDGQTVDLLAELNFIVQAHGRLDSGNFEITADFDQAELSPYLALALDSRWGGEVSGKLHASGNWNSLNQTTGRLTIGSAEIRHNNRVLVANEGLDIEIDAGYLKMPQARFSLLQDGFLVVEADGDMQRNANAIIDGRLPLVALSPFTELLSDVEGDVTLHGEIRGRLDNPKWQADLRFEEVGFVLPELLQAVEKINGRLTVGPDAIVIDELTGALDTGSFGLDGRVQLKDGMPSKGSLRLTMLGLPIQWPDTMELVVSGDLELQGSTKGGELSGDIVLVEGLYYKDVRFNLLSSVKQRRRAQKVPTLRSRPKWMQRIAVDVRLRHLNPLLVDNNLAYLEIVPDLQLRGTLANPVLSGRAAVNEGELIYGRKVFTVNRGVVDFINPNRTEPKLDIMSEVQFRKWLITLGVSGPLDNLEFTLSSTPAESDNDILSLLLTGRTNAEMIEGKGSGKTTNQMLAELLASTWGEDIKQGTGVDIFEVGAGSDEDAEDPTSMQLTVGKRIGRRLTLKYDVETQEGEMIQRAISEYRFLEHILASGFQDSRGRYGGELLFRMDFR